MAKGHSVSENTHAATPPDSCPPERDAPDNTAFDDDDEFGGFGEEFRGSDVDDDFGDFNDFGEPETPVKEPTPERAPVESVLTASRALFRPSADRAEQLTVLKQCTDMAFGTDCEQPEAPRPQLPVALLSPSKVSNTVSSLAATRDLAVAAEPRLVRNLLLLAAVSPHTPEARQRELLTPLSELSLADNSGDHVAKDATALDIGEIRRLAAQSADLLDSAAGRASLGHALESIRFLVAAKEQEVAKRKDAVDAYNHVIQTLVAQATKLH
ncbi:hypothetical protein LPJ70_003943 [Coemansia sp. RSA 2708]|nr:hypothetical protein LPJ70_003943 [Coemansia sp. RSA 2708]